ncbi:MAG: hypothetical protein ABI353_21660 [Isosphaeraceae bacterium]
MTNLLQARFAPLLITVAVLVMALVPLPGSLAKSVRQDLQSLSLNRADREAGGGGYYEGLINGGLNDRGGGLTLRLLGKPTQWISFHDVDAVQYSKEDFLLFELKPNVNRVVFGQPFTTNQFGLRDRPYTKAKPEGTFRIALLGSSIDMGWGVGTEQTYENLLEDWLNTQAARLGSTRKFEVLNFAVAAYSPLQRVEVFRRKATEFQPDLVFYSATMLDTRLTQLHLLKVLQCHVDVRHDFVRRILAEAGIKDDDLALGKDGELRLKDALKDKLRPHLWELGDEALGLLAADCRSRGVPLACLMIPRAGQSDPPSVRAPLVAQQEGIAARHAIAVVDIMDTFDHSDPNDVSIAPWDDHPNDQGHNLMFRALARALAEDGTLSPLLFDGPTRRKESP